MLSTILLQAASAAADTSGYGLAAIGAGLAALGAGVGIGQIGGKALESIARHFDRFLQLHSNTLQSKDEYWEEFDDESPMQPQELQLLAQMIDGNGVIHLFHTTYSSKLYDL